MNVIELTKALINIPSITPEGKACLDIISQRLEQLDFNCERIPVEPADNLWARRGTAKPLVCFLGHVDVVPPGSEDQWQSSPFSATEQEGFLYGRGACDMKSGVAAFIVAIENFIAEQPNFSGSIGVMITTAEEAMDQFGIPNVVEHLEQRQEKIDYCITGEPSSTDQVGDVIRIGRRGSLNAECILYGKQGHVAYPHLADNPIHKLPSFLSELVNTQWDQGNKDFPPTSLQVTNINAGTGATNVIPCEVNMQFNFRFSPEVMAEQLQQRVIALLDQHQLPHQLKWQLSGQPFYTQSGQLVNAAVSAIKKHCQLSPTLSTGGGTSDARFIAPTGAEVIELGVCNATAHKVNECVAINDLPKLATIYQEILRLLFKSVRF